MRRHVEDRLPHRGHDAAPPCIDVPALRCAEGRIESDGTLLCSYHGWRFNGEGKCTSIPQARTIQCTDCKAIVVFSLVVINVCVVTKLLV